MAKIKFKLILLVISFFSLVIFAPAAALAQVGSGGNCVTDSNCQQGYWCNLNSSSGSTCQAINNATPCQTNADCQTDKTGLTCTSGVCGVPGGAGAAAFPSQCQLNGLSGPSCCAAYPTDPLCSTAGTGGSPAAVSGSCPSPLVSAANGLCLPPNTNTTCAGVSCSSSLTDLIVRVITILLTLSGAIAVVFLIIGGFWYMTAAGNEEQAEKGKNTITNFFLGLVIVIMAYALVTIVNNLLTGGASQGSQTQQQTIVQ